MESQVSVKPYKETDSSVNDDSGTDTLYIDLDVSTTDDCKSLGGTGDIRSDTEEDVESEVVNTCNSTATERQKQLDISSNSGDDVEREVDNTMCCQLLSPKHHMLCEQEKQCEPVSIPAKEKPAPPPLTPVISDYPSPGVPSYPFPSQSDYPGYPMFYPGMMSSPHPAYLLQRMFELQNYRSVESLATTAIHTKQMNDGRTSPADSLSSGVSSSSSPSPIRSSPKTSPRTPKQSSPSIPETHRRTPGGRTSYTPHQVRTMEKIFSSNRYPDYDVLENISDDLGIPAKKIKVWFQNKQARSKSRCPDVSVDNMAAMMSSTPVYSFPVHSLMTSLPVPSPYAFLSIPWTTHALYVWIISSMIHI